MNGFEFPFSELDLLCKRHNVEKLYLFGSVLGDRFSADSDIDILVKFLPVDLFHYFENYLSLKENLEEITGRTVDLVEEQTLKNPVLKGNIDKNKQLVYG